jgi:hypothetical protein
MAGLGPAISLAEARPCQSKRDHRVSALRAGPVMTSERLFSAGKHMRRQHHCG